MGSSNGFVICTKHKEVNMEITHEDVVMMRLVKQATAQGLVMAQHFQSREILLLAPNGNVHHHADVALVRSWLRHYANCGRYGRRCFYQRGLTCSCVPGLTPFLHRDLFTSRR